MTRMRPRLLIVFLALVICPGASEATWSIVLADKRTKEVGIGSVTCLTNFDLRALTPVILTGIGGAAVQAAGDFNGIRRPIIFDGFMAGDTPQEILATLANVSGHAQRQYGIVDTHGRGISYTGPATGGWTGGVVGEVGDLFYAIQGNVLAGPCVVPAIEEAILNTPGDMAEKLMLGMEAARQQGGDGRCSCNQTNPESCGCPPLTGQKSGHIGYMIIARIGDVDDLVCNQAGCADGDYFMNFNLPFQNPLNPDPVDFMRDFFFDPWRDDLVGRPDAVQSPATITPDGNDFLLTLELRDWQSLPITVPISSLVVEHLPESAMVTTVGAVTDLGGGVYEVPLTVGAGTGLDQLRITVDDGIRPVVLMPDVTICHGPLGEDCNGNGIRDECDARSDVSEDENGNDVPDECETFIRGDCNADSFFDIADVIFTLDAFFSGGAPPECERSCDSNDDGTVDAADPIYSLNDLFIFGPDPLPPYPECGVDFTPDTLECAPNAACP